MCSSAPQPLMKFILVFTLCQVFLYLHVFSQVGDRLSSGEVQRFDSMATAFRASDRRVRLERDDSVISLLMHERNESEGMLLEAKRMERDANGVAVEARTAVRNEKRVQREKERMDRRVEKSRRTFEDKSNDADVN